MKRCQLLISVRNVQEAQDAARAGADLIDIKEPSAGSLGAAMTTEITNICDCMCPHYPVSAAFGEWADFDTRTLIDPRLQLVKWGLSGLRGQLATVYPNMRAIAGTRAVLVLYADDVAAQSPTIAECLALRQHLPINTVLIDTYRKDGRGLLDHLSRQDLQSFISEMRKNGTQVALAGSLQLRDIPRLLPLQPDWLAFRGAACDGGREASISLDKVNQLAAAIQTAV